MIALLLAALAAGSIWQESRAEETSKAEQRRLFRAGARLWPVYHAAFAGARAPSSVTLAGCGKTIFQRISARQDSLYMSITHLYHRETGLQPSFSAAC
jgi:hypothetical protein